MSAALAAPQKNPFLFLFVELGGARLKVFCGEPAGSFCQALGLRAPRLHTEKLARTLLVPPYSRPAALSCYLFSCASCAILIVSCP